MAVILRIKTQITYGSGGPGFSQIYFLPGAAGGSNTDATNCAAAVRAFWLALAARLGPTATYLVSGVADAVNDTDGVLVGGFTGTTPGAVVATGTGTQLPPATQILARLTTSTVINGKRVLGRVYCGPVDSSSSTSGSPTTGVGTAVTAAGAALLAVAGGAVPVVWHRPGPNGPGSSASLVAAVGAPFFAVLRSRRD